jgi:3',5'-cyclic-nucleotide phosphodiesterase/cAMP-specific phosphodiesterase 4
MILETDMSRHFEILGKFKAKTNNLNLENLEEKLMILGMGLKCADIGHSAKSTELHERWTQLVCEEFFLQGDVEKERKQNVSMYCDRENTDVAKSQAGFIKNICIPLYEVWCNYLDSEIIFNNCLKQLEKNYKHWDDKFKQRKCSAQVETVVEAQPLKLSI